MQLTNENKLSISVAAWLASDDYDHDSDPNTISTTGLLKSVRQIVLGSRVKSENIIFDITENVASRFGTAVHDAIEKAWKPKNYPKSLSRLGHSQAVIDRIRVNPKPAEVTKDIIPIYMEQRAKKTLGKYTVSGKYDFVGNGTLEDFKTTSVFTYITKSNDEKYRLQGSIYRWLNPTIITDDVMTIQYIFTDWSKLQVSIRKKDGYPPYRMMGEPIQLMPLADTEQWLVDKLALIDKYMKYTECDLPLCTPEELWQKESKFAYYKNPAKTARSTANFDSYAEAQHRLVQDGAIGIIHERKAPVKACNYCGAFDLCTQKDAYLADGSLQRQGHIQ